MDKVFIRILGRIWCQQVYKEPEKSCIFQSSRFYLFLKFNLPLASSSVLLALISTQPNWQPSEQHLNPSSQSASIRHRFNSSSGGRHSLSLSIGGHSPETRYVYVCEMCFFLCTKCKSMKKFIMLPLTLHKKMKYSIQDFFSKVISSVTDLVTFTEEILNGKLHFLCNVYCAG